MLEYELLYILPGTLTEEEAGPLFETVKDVVIKAGGANLTVEPGGKNRLAYPVKHIRYGFFFLCYFQADAAAIPVMDTRLRLLPHALRLVIKKQAPGAPRGLSVAFVPVTRELAMAQREENRELGIPEPAAAPRPMPPVAPIQTKTETKVEDISIDDINQKLDKILSEDMANV